MKRTCIFAILLASASFFNCGPPPVTPEEATKNISVAIGEDRVQIPLDDKIPGAMASLTRNFYFVFDGSGSMADGPDGSCGGDKSFLTKIEGAKWAVREFIKKVPTDVNLGLYIFDSNGQREVVSLSPGIHKKFLNEIDNVQASGGTPLARGIYYGTERLVEQYKRQLGYGEYRLVVVTDGQADSVPEASLNAIKYGISIYAIGLCIGDNHPLRQYALSYRAADSVEDLRRGLEQTLAELPNFDINKFKPVEADKSK